MYEDMITEQKRKYAGLVQKCVEEAFTDPNNDVCLVRNFREATDDEDKNESFDFAFKSYKKEYQLSLRIFTPEMFDKYHTITIRKKTQQDLGVTEFEKINNGKSNFYLFAYENPQRTGFDHWLLIDLNIFRYRGILINYYYKATNQDGSEFACYHIDMLKTYPGLIIKSFGI